MITPSFGINPVKIIPIFKLIKENICILHYLDPRTTFLGYALSRTNAESFKKECETIDKCNPIRIEEAFAILFDNKSIHLLGQNIEEALLAKDSDLFSNIVHKDVSCETSNNLK